MLLIWFGTSVVSRSSIEVTKSVTEIWVSYFNSHEYEKINDGQKPCSFIIWLFYAVQMHGGFSFCSESMAFTCESCKNELIPPVNEYLHYRCVGCMLKGHDILPCKYCKTMSFSAQLSVMMVFKCFEDTQEVVSADKADISFSKEQDERMFISESKKSVHEFWPSLANNLMSTMANLSNEVADRKKSTYNKACNHVAIG